MNTFKIICQLHWLAGRSISCCNGGIHCLGMCNDCFEVFEIYGDVHILFDDELFKILLVTGYRGVNWVF